jgi:hypothetical protein
MTDSPAPTERDRFWLDHEAAVAASGQTAKGYAAEHGLSFHAFYQARKRLRALGCASFSLRQSQGTPEPPENPGRFSSNDPLDDTGAWSKLARSPKARLGGYGPVPESISKNTCLLPASGPSAVHSVRARVERTLDFGHSNVIRDAACRLARRSALSSLRAARSGDSNAAKSSARPIPLNRGDLNSVGP